MALGLPFAICFALLLSTSLGQLEYYKGKGKGQGQRPHRGQGQGQYGQECAIDQLNALEPTIRFESEAGLTEYWDNEDQQFQCAGVAAARFTIEPRGLLLPSYTSSPRLVYIVQGSGYGGVVMPGCPETFQSFDEQSSHRQDRDKRQDRQGEREQGDEHQRVQRVRQGDVVALPAGIVNWFFNDGDNPLVAVSIMDVTNEANQLDNIPRKFFLAGSEAGQQGGRPGGSQGRRGGQDRPSGQQGGRPGGQQGGGSRFEELLGRNILQGFDAEILSEALGVSRETTRKIQGEEGQQEQKGHIVRVERGFKVSKPTREDIQDEKRRGRPSGSNGVEETLMCNARLRENIGDPQRADVYSREGGHLTTLTSAKLPILAYLDLSAERGHLKRNAIFAPHWHMNAHSILYVIEGSARVQIVSNDGNAVFDDRLRQNQMLVIPQNFMALAQAEEEDFRWISFKTSDNALTSPLVGKRSVFRGIPADVLANAYDIPRNEAQNLKDGRREESLIMTPRSRLNE